VNKNVTTLKLTYTAKGVDSRIRQILHNKFTVDSLLDMWGPSLNIETSRFRLFILAKMMNYEDASRKAEKPK